MLKKLAAVLLSCLMLSQVSVALGAANSEVTTVTRTQKKVAVECPKVVSGNGTVNTKINAELNRVVNNYATQASSLGGGTVHYDVHKCDKDLISFTVVMTPKQGVEETTGVTFDRATGAVRPISYYYNSSELLSRSADGLKYLYDVDASKVKTEPDAYYVDTDSNVIGIYHAGAILDKSEGEIEVNLSAADPVIEKTPVTPPPVYTGEGDKGTITGTDVRMRSGAGLNTEIMGYFENGETVKVLKSDVEAGMKWYQVTRSDGSTGWVSADYCNVPEGTKVPTTTVTSEKKGRITGTEVRMRSDPNTNADILDYFEKGEEVVILDAASGSQMNWTKVRRANGKTGWVASDYCQEISQ